MNHLVPCSSCGRHLRASEVSCPFCGEGRDPAGSRAPVLPRGRLSRAATLAFGALLGASAITACGDDDDEDGTGDGDAGESSDGDAGSAATTGGTGGSPSPSGGSVAVPVYGAPAPTGGTLGTGGRPATGGTGASHSSGEPAAPNDWSPS